MNLDTDEGISQALREIATWSSPDAPVGPEAGPDRVMSTDPGSSSDKARRRLRSRGALVAASLLIAVGLGGLLAHRPVLIIEASQDSGPGLNRATALDLCLDVETEYDLDQLRSGGTLHLFGAPSNDEVYLVVSGDSLHAACGLAQRDNAEWISVTTFIETDQKPATDGALSIATTIRLRDRVYIVGQVGGAVSSASVEHSNGVAMARVDDGWWGASFQTNDGLLDGYPDFRVVWTTDTGESSSSHADDLQTPGPWLSCARDEVCNSDRWAELVERAKGLDRLEQATALEDGVVTDAEYRAALRAWATCITDMTGATATFDDHGLFTINDDSDGDSTTEAFDLCQEQHASLVTEAVGLQGTSTDDQPTTPGGAEGSFEPKPGLPGDD